MLLIIKYYILKKTNLYNIWFANDLAWYLHTEG